MTILSSCNIIRKYEMKPEKIAIIVNPAAGQEKPILKIFNDVFTRNNIDWNIFITKKSGDAKKFAYEASENGYDIVVACGGDGTVKEVAHGLSGKTTPMAIIPGGTANILAIELNIPFDISEACRLISNCKNIRRIDTGTINGEFFVLRAGSGFEADMVRGATRSLKNMFGGFAYGLSALGAVFKSRNSIYKIKIDGVEFKEEGLSCIVANVGNIGIPGLSLSNSIKIDDGLLDVIVVQNANFFNMIPNAINNIEKWDKLISPLLHFSGKEISLEIDPLQKIQCDGEKFNGDRIEARILPGSLKIVV
jgi:YegS/Rv2252/BmrU family lipid kinase